MISTALLTLSLLTAPFVGAYAPQKAGSAPLEPELEARVQALGKKLRCATCQGLSISDSPASMARSQLDKVRELVSAGKSDDEIREYFVARYGEWVLLDPPKQGWNLLIWAGPGVLLLGGAAVIAMQLRGKAKRDAAAGAPGARAASGTPAVAAGAAGGGSATLDDDYLRAVREELER